MVHAKTAERKMPGLGLQMQGAVFASRDATHDRTAYTLPAPVGGCRNSVGCKISTVTQDVILYVNETIAAA